MTNFYAKKNVFTITNDHHESLNTLKANLTRATDLTLRLAKPGRQYVIFCDASFHGTGFVLVIEQQNEEVIREVVSWKNRGNPGESPNLPLALRKYRKQFHRLVVEDDVLYRLFYDDCGKVKYKQFGVQKTLWRDLFSASIIRKLTDILALPKQLKNFEKVSFFQILPNFSVLQLKTALLAYN